MNTFPDHMPNSGEQVPADPADFLRDLFLANKGVIDAMQLGHAMGRHTFTYGQKILDAWESLKSEEYVVREGPNWVWPMQRWFYSI